MFRTSFSPGKQTSHYTSYPMTLPLRLSDTQLLSNLNLPYDPAFSFAHVW